MIIPSLLPPLPVGPTVITNPVDMTVTTNDNLVLNCTAMNNEGAPRPLEVNWIFEGRVLMNDQDTMIVNEMSDENMDIVTSTLTVPRVTRSNAGQYQCSAFNREFTDDGRSELATVTVNC